MLSEGFRVLTVNTLLTPTAGDCLRSPQSNASGIEFVCLPESSIRPT